MSEPVPGEPVWQVPQVENSASSTKMAQPVPVWTEQQIRRVVLDVLASKVTEADVDALINQLRLFHLGL